jgi:hypothetical protein
MATAQMTETVVRTETVTLELTLDEARALMSLTRRADTAEAGAGPVHEIRNVNLALKAAGVPTAPFDRMFRAVGSVMFSSYQEMRP